jgi:hypothetical protein
VTWSDKDVPAEVRELPAGCYVVEAVDDEAPALSPDEEAGIEAALESHRQGAPLTRNALATSSPLPSGIELHVHGRKLNERKPTGAAHPHAVIARCIVPLVA